MRAVGPDFLAQARDVYVDRAVQDDHFVVPDPGEDLFAREDHPRVGKEQGEDFELLFGQGNLLSVHPADLALQVEAEPFETDGFLLLRGLRAAQHAPYPGRHFAHREGFGDIVVVTQVQARNGVVFGVFGRAEDDRHGSRFGRGLEHTGHFEAADLSHHYVEQQQRITFGMHRQRLFGAVSHIHFVSFEFEVEFQDFTQRPFVVHHQNFVFPHDLRIDSTRQN